MSKASQLWEKVLYEDTWRTSTAAFAALPLTWGGAMVWTMTDPAVGDPDQLWAHSIQVAFMTFVLGWIVMGVFYPALTHLAYSRLSAPEFHQRLSGDPSKVRSWTYRLLVRQGPWSETVIGFVIAIGLLFSAMRGNGPVGLTAALVLAIGVIVSSWVLLVVNYALVFARLNARAGRQAHVVFPGEESPLFTDYVSFSTFVSTSVAPTGAEVVTTEARRAARAQTLVAFVFNTIIIALLVSFLGSTFR